MSKLEELTRKIIKFRDERDWKQFHNPKDLAISFVLEASELLGHFQWRSKEEISEYVKTNKLEISEEIADILFLVLLMSHDLEVDILKVLEQKILKNTEKYPIEKSKGKHTKYTKLK